MTRSGTWSDSYEKTRDLSQKPRAFPPVARRVCDRQFLRGRECRRCKHGASLRRTGSTFLSCIRNSKSECWAVHSLGYQVVPTVQLWRYSPPERLRARIHREGHHGRRARVHMAVPRGGHRPEVSQRGLRRDRRRCRVYAGLLLTPTDVLYLAHRSLLSLTHYLLLFKLCAGLNALLAEGFVGDWKEGVLTTGLHGEGKGQAEPRGFRWCCFF